ncbi:2OG-Fe dioxygenase family protein [Photobacterium halotolerans]|uniref:Agglutination protein n=1 Tax=Photobacterium halotolerans TaxID=265726 RepID=A0A7X5ARU8_9GAMM|nr:2OG-Fe dioxygenase family protein [Photobacterium halotolerans]NAW64127.1 agglutination protein [Photobacterium halotolerans]NAX49118.1 agglutination protein [Photobacterium halotolerans]
MNVSLDRTFQLTQLSGQAINDLSPSFNHLPKTGHADGEYRLRRYSIVKATANGVQHMPPRAFVQSDDINHFQGNVSRTFEPLEDKILFSAGMREMCEVFKRANALSDEQEIEIHQIRIAALEGETQVAPEGVHQDGFNHIAVIGIGRENIEGGEFLVYKNKNQLPFLSMALEQGEVAILADDQLWHNARPIKAVKKDQKGYMDLFVLTARETQYAV